MSVSDLLGAEARLGLRRLLTLEWGPPGGEAPRCQADVLPEGSRWEPVLRALEAHGLAPWAHEALGVAGLRDGVPAFVAARLRDHYRATVLRNRMLLGALEEITALCAAKDIEIIPLKGATLARRLYRDPGLRPMQDLDLLVRPEAAAAAGRALRGAGYRVPAHLDEAATQREHFHCVYERAAAGVKVELHWSLGEEAALPAAALAGLWQRSLPGPVPGQRALDEATELVVVAVHAWRHGILNPALVGEERLRPLLFEPLSGNRLLWLLDLHRLQRAGTADPGLCRARAWEWDAAASLQGAIVLAGEAFGSVPAWGLPGPPPQREASLARLLILRHLARGLLAGSPGSARLVERLSRMDPHLQARPIRAIELLDRFRAPAPLRELRARHGVAVLPLCWVGATLAGAGALARAGALACRSRLRRRRFRRTTAAMPRNNPDALGKAPEEGAQACPGEGGELEE